MLAMAQGAWVVQDESLRPLQGMASLPITFATATGGVVRIHQSRQMEVRGPKAVQDGIIASLGSLVGKSRPTALPPLELWVPTPSGSQGF